MQGRESSPDCLDERIVVAVAALEHRTGARRDGVDPIDPKEPAFPDRDTTFVRSLRLVGWRDHRQHQIPRLHPVHLFLPHEIASRKAVFGKERPAILPTPTGADTQRAQGAGPYLSELAHAERVRPPLQVPIGKLSAPSARTRA
jgi:hypothetical protein